MSVDGNQILLLLGYYGIKLITKKYHKFLDKSISG